MRLEFGDLGRIERLEVDAIGLAIRALLCERVLQRLRRPIDAHVTGAADKPEQPGLRHQRFMLGDAALHQRPRPAGGLGHLLRRRRAPVAEQPRRDGGQRAPMQVGLGQLVERVPRHQGDIAWKRIGHYAFALDEAGVAVARLLARTAPVDEHHRPPALLQVEGGADADHAGTEHNDVRSLHEDRPSRGAGDRSLCI